jgi:hypothetical protein
MFLLLRPDLSEELWRNGCVYEGDVIVKWFFEDRIKPQIIH